MISKKKEQKLKDTIDILSSDLDATEEMLHEAETERDNFMSYALFVTKAAGHSAEDENLTLGDVLNTILNLRADKQELDNLKVAIRQFVWGMK